MMVFANNIDELARRIHEKAKEFGADLAGIAHVADLKRSPSHRISQKMPEYDGVGTRDAGARIPGVVDWPQGAKSAIVIAAAHPPEKPEMDWWLSTHGSAGNTEGNRQLIWTVTRLAAWFEKEQAIRCFKLPYHIEYGGVYMKDAAVLAGLGCIGKNNLFLTPQFGPRLRLRVVLTDADLPSEGAARFNPCEDCAAPCRAVCPQDAFAEQVYAAQDYGIEALPGRDGTYSRLHCNRQMVKNESEVEAINAEDPGKSAMARIKYCRECELVCPVGLS